MTYQEPSASHLRRWKEFGEYFDGMSGIISPWSRQYDYIMSDLAADTWTPTRNPDWRHRFVGCSLRMSQVKMWDIYQWRNFLPPALTLLEGRMETEPNALGRGHLRNGIPKEYELIIRGKDTLAVFGSKRGKLVCRHEVRSLKDSYKGTQGAVLLVWTTAKRLLFWQVQNIYMYTAGEASTCDINIITLRYAVKQGMMNWCYSRCFMNQGLKVDYIQHKGQSEIDEPFDSVFQVRFMRLASSPVPRPGLLDHATKHMYTYEIRVFLDI